MPSFNKILTTDEEKLSYVKKYLSSVNRRPLVILGEGGTGKTNIVNRVIQNCKKNIVKIDNGGPPYFQKGEPDNYDLKMIIISCISNEDYMKQLDEGINPIFIRFEYDPAFNHTE
jgi:hypothetical protein